jgi:transposase
VTSRCVAVGIDLFFLPIHSPELQPAERLWPLTNEARATHSLLNLEELENLLIYRCHKIMEQHRLVQGLTCFHWWHKTTGT